MDKDERKRARVQSLGPSNGPSKDKGKGGVRTDVRVDVQAHGNVEEEVDVDVNVTDDDSGDDGMSWMEVMRVGRGLAHVPVQLAHLTIDGTCFVFLVLSG